MGDPARGRLEVLQVVATDMLKLYISVCCNFLLVQLSISCWDNAVNITWLGEENIVFRLKIPAFGCLLACSSYTDSCPAFGSNSGVQVLLPCTSSLWGLLSLTSLTRHQLTREGSVGVF